MIDNLVILSLSLDYQLSTENERKFQLAAASGVNLELLDPLDNLEQPSTVYDETGNIQIKGGSDQKNTHWYAEVDEELQQEWNALVGTSNNETNRVENVKVQVSGGKVISKESLHGVRVGSAGGWSLEVFPGDYVVHR